MRDEYREVLESDPEIQRLQKEIASLEVQRLQATQDVIKAQGDLTESKAGFRGGAWLPPAEYAQKSARHRALIKNIADCQGRAAKVRMDLRLVNDAHDARRRAIKNTMHIERKTMLAEERVGMVSEYDLENQLVEPVDLLRRSYGEIMRLSAIAGRSERTAAVIEALHEFLRRRGVVV